MRLLLAPHSDDETLFASFVIQRTSPLVVICTDGVLHEKKFKISVQTRRNESIMACRLLKAEVDFLGISDAEMTDEELRGQLETLSSKPWDMVFAPSLTGGHAHHDMLSRVATEIWGERVVYYETYSQTSYHPDGEMRIIPTPAESRIKTEALKCYHSQLGINKPHFDAAANSPEYLSFKP